ncbi:uncharacterized protein LOC18432183 [Amborella trichopoda]|uniref:Uncharacterized protein n=1 Tax=Amborella trichopoda TaxID=13333 RepID=W1P8V1_AMBTC|nr:uncharacterized protein LOC18432183 [Amborella trichopoda]ERN04031.1 hypothetical protein AMTR_s00079p00179880 [Amborella trichopoda]|eukprot:XP_006842356.3 uncharacterized protein LOC18432183 [Amborella trichopoda]
MKLSKESSFFHMGRHLLPFFLITFGMVMGVLLSLHTSTPYTVHLIPHYSSNPIAVSKNPVPPPTYPKVEEVAKPTDAMHNMTDEELMWQASMVSHVRQYPYSRVPKVAFMYLTRGPMPLGPLWERFFKGHNGLYSIYVHCPPSYTVEAPPDSVFFRRKVPSKVVEWGRATMIDAERRLLANALLDFSNERFVLLSESCIPLFNFTTAYSYLINSHHSFVGSFDDPRHCGRGRYNKTMAPEILLSEWRKGSQWFEVNRALAIEIVSDTKYYAIFREHCNPPCYMDEHYLPTFVTKNFPSSNSNRSFMWVDWSRGGSHPATFRSGDATERFLNQIRNSENCTYNGNPTSICFLFARKWAPNALQPLLRIAPRVLGLPL